MMWAMGIFNTETGPTDAVVDAADTSASGGVVDPAADGGTDTDAPVATGPDIKPKRKPKRKSKSKSIDESNDGTYTLQPGDNPFSVARDLYGRGTRGRELVLANPGVRWKAGVTINLI